MALDSEKLSAEERANFERMKALARQLFAVIEKKVGTSDTKNSEEATTLINAIVSIPGAHLSACTMQGFTALHLAVIKK